MPTEAGVINKESFSKSFPALRSLILNEWSEVDEAKLDSTAGEFDKVIELLTERTGQTKAMTKKQLEELFFVANAPPTQPIGNMIDTMLHKARQGLSQNVFQTLFTSAGVGFIAGVLFVGITTMRRRR